MLGQADKTFKVESKEEDGPGTPGPVSENAEEATPAVEHEKAEITAGDEKEKFCRIEGDEFGESATRFYAEMIERLDQRKDLKETDLGRVEKEITKTLGTIKKVGFVMAKSHEELEIFRQLGLRMVTNVEHSLNKKLTEGDKETIYEIIEQVVDGYVPAEKKDAEKTGLDKEIFDYFESNGEFFDEFEKKTEAILNDRDITNGRREEVAEMSKIVFETWGSLGDRYFDKKEISQEVLNGMVNCKKEAEEYLTEIATWEPIKPAGESGSELLEGKFQELEKVFETVKAEIGKVEIGKDTLQAETFYLGKLDEVDKTGLAIDETGNFEAEVKKKQTELATLWKAKSEEYAEFYKKIRGKKNEELENKQNTKKEQIEFAKLKEKLTTAIGKILAISDEVFEQKLAGSVLGESEGDCRIEMRQGLDENHKRYLFHLSGELDPKDVEEDKARRAQVFEVVDTILDKRSDMALVVSGGKTYTIKREALKTLTEKEKNPPPAWQEKFRTLAADIARDVSDEKFKAEYEDRIVEVFDNDFGERLLRTVEYSENHDIDSFAPEQKALWEKYVVAVDDIRKNKYTVIFYKDKTYLIGKERTQSPEEKTPREIFFEIDEELREIFLRNFIRQKERYAVFASENGLTKEDVDGAMVEYIQEALEKYAGGIKNFASVAAYVYENLI